MTPVLAVPHCNSKVQGGGRGGTTKPNYSSGEMWKLLSWVFLQNVGPVKILSSVDVSAKLVDMK